MNTLFISTYQELIEIGLLRDGKLITKKDQLSNRNHSIYTIPLIKEILDENKIDVKNLNEIIVIDGPGSFTGVRLGITVAKTLAYTLNIPIKCLSSIEALAVSSNSQKAIIIVEDPKGKYYEIIDDNETVNEIKYASNKDFEELIKTSYEDYQIINNIRLDLEKIYIYAANIKPTPAHAVKARYVKGIEALNGK